MENLLKDFKKKAIKAFMNSCPHSRWGHCGLESALNEECDEKIGCGGLHYFIKELNKELNKEL